jgi:hypothetical protein
MDPVTGPTGTSVKDLAEAFGKQAKYSNQLWLALIGAAVVVNFPHKTGTVIDLPFSLGSVEEGVFAPAAFLILAVLSVAYCVAFAESNNAARFAHRQIDNFSSDEVRRLYDLLAIATFSRVAPLVNLTNYRLNHWPAANKIASAYYVILKLVANVIILGIPIGSLITAYLRVLQGPSISVLAFWITRFSTFALVVTAVAFIQIIIAEVLHDAYVARLYWNRRIPLQ